MIKQLNKQNIYVQNSILNTCKGFDSKKFRRAFMRKKIQPSIKENLRNRKTKRKEKNVLIMLKFIKTDS